MTPGSFATRSPTFNRMPSSSKTMMARSPSSRPMQLRKQSSTTSSKAGKEKVSSGVDMTGYKAMMKNFDK